MSALRHEMQISEPPPVPGNPPPFPPADPDSPYPVDEPPGGPPIPPEQPAPLRNAPARRAADRVRAGGFDPRPASQPTLRTEGGFHVPASADSFGQYSRITT